MLCQCNVYVDLHVHCMSQSHSTDTKSFMLVLCMVSTSCYFIHASMASLNECGQTLEKGQHYFILGYCDYVNNIVGPLL